MESEARYMWSLSSLSCAFLDLAFAFFSLCASAVVFLKLKFLGICGLLLPCPCNWLFGIAQNDIQNLQRLLSDLATEKVSNVKLSVKEKYPYNNAQNIHLNVRLIGEREGNVHSQNGLGFVEMEVEALSSSVSDIGMSSNGEKIEFKPRKLVKKYKRRRSFDRCRVFSFSRFDPQYVELRDDQQWRRPPSIDDKRNEMSEDSQELFNSGIDACSNATGFGQRDSFKLDENVFPYDDDDENSEHDLSSEELNSHVQMDQLYNINDKSAIRILEKALEEEKSARAALYLELEKERNAAASAADEAMAMISRLQEEKALIEMEARQYKRIIEEKSAYEAEEMEILREILVRRETEKHFLEMEVEAYRQMIYLGNDDHIAANEKNLFGFLPDLSEADPVLMLSEICDSAEKKAIKESKSSDDECLRHNSEDSYEEIECFSNLSSDKEHHVYDVHVKENVQLKLLEDIACQLQEIRHLTVT